MGERGKPGASSPTTPAIAANSPTVKHNGFSTNTAFPAASPCNTSRAWLSCRVVITSAAVPASANSASVSVVVRSKPNLRPACTPLTPPLEATVRNTAPAALKAGINTPVA